MPGEVVVLKVLSHIRTGRWNQAEAIDLAAGQVIHLNAEDARWHLRDTPEEFEVLASSVEGFGVEVKTVEEIARTQPDPEQAPEEPAEAGEEAAVEGEPEAAVDEHGDVSSEATAETEPPPNEEEAAEPKQSKKSRPRK